jgi:hypothetical protein
MRSLLPGVRYLQRRPCAPSSTPHGAGEKGTNSLGGCGCNTVSAAPHVPRPPAGARTAPATAPDSYTTGCASPHTAALRSGAGARPPAEGAGATGHAARAAGRQHDPRRVFPRPPNPSSASPPRCAPQPIRFDDWFDYPPCGRRSIAPLLHAAKPARVSGTGRALCE